MRGFTILEVLLVTMLMSLLCLGCLGFYLEMFMLVHNLEEESEILHQLQTGLDIVVRELQEADPQSIQFSQSMNGGFGEILFTKYYSPTQYKFYISSKNKLIQGIKHSGSNWGYIILAEGVEALVFQTVQSNSAPGYWIHVQVGGSSQDKYIELESGVSAGF